MKVAIAHEWVDRRAGSEKTFEALAQLLPDADLFALTWNPRAELEIGERTPTLSFLDRSILRDRREWTLPLMPLAWRRVRRPVQYDLVISSSHAAVKGFWAGRHTTHLCYCHAPMRYAWQPELDERGSGYLRAPVRSLLRRWDKRSARWVDHFAANSDDVAGRIKSYYGRQATVIPPPVNVDFFSAAPARPRSGALAVSRWISYKRLDLAIEACSIAGVPLTIAGGGPEGDRLRELATAIGADIRFVLEPDDYQLRALYGAAELLVFPGHEDFGIVPVEAMAAGTPVVALGRGGTADSVMDGATGVHVAHQSADAFASAIKEALAARFDPEACRRQAKKFCEVSFGRNIRGWIERAVGPPAETIEWGDPRSPSRR